MTLSEAQFTNQGIQLARLGGWLVNHQRPGLTRSGKWVTATQGHIGWPDLVLCHPTRHLFLIRELKTDSRASKPTPEQEAWLAALQGAGVDAGVWRPSDMDRIEHLLLRKAAP